MSLDPESLLSVQATNRLRGEPSRGGLLDTTADEDTEGGGEDQEEEEGDEEDDEDEDEGDEEDEDE